MARSAQDAVEDGAGHARLHQLVDDVEDGGVAKGTGPGARVHRVLGNGDGKGLGGGAGGADSQQILAFRADAIAQIQLARGTVVGNKERQAAHQVQQLRGGAFQGGAGLVQQIFGGDQFRIPQEAVFAKGAVYIGGEEGKELRAFRIRVGCADEEAAIELAFLGEGAAAAELDSLLIRRAKLGLQAQLVPVPCGKVGEEESALARFLQVQTAAQDGTEPDRCQAEPGRTAPLMS